MADRELIAHRLVVGYNRTESSRRAIDWAAEHLRGQKAKLVIVHACRPLHAPPSPLSTAAERAATGRAIVDELLLEADESLLDIDIDTLTPDQDPVTALLDAARRYDAEAIVIGSEPHSLLHKALGTVSGELHNTASIPVIAIPAEMARHT